MTEFSFVERVRMFLDAEENPEEFMYGDVDCKLDENVAKYDIAYEFIEQHGGEGQGDDYWSVFKFTDNTSTEEQYVKFKGWYSSGYGSEYDSFHFVSPQEKTITVYV